MRQLGLTVYGRFKDVLIEGCVCEYVYVTDLYEIMTMCTLPSSYWSLQEWDKALS